MINFVELAALMRGLAGSAAEWNDAAVKALLTAMDSDNDGKARRRRERGETGILSTGAGC